MPGEEICIIIIPNDFPRDVDGEQSITNSGQEKISQVKCSYKIANINEQTRSKSAENMSEDLFDDSSPSTIGQHTVDYPCPQCNESLASRLRYHTIPKLQLCDTVWISTNNNESFFIICYTESGPQSDGILYELRRAEIGVRSGTKVFVIPLSCEIGIRRVVEKQKTLRTVRLKDDNQEKQQTDNEVTDTPKEISTCQKNIPTNRFLKSVRAHLTIRKIIETIRNDSLLTFDYLLFCILASMIAALGLLENSSIILVASMLVSPLMGPIMGLVIGLRIRDKKLWLTGLKSECIGIVVAILTGLLCGLCTTWTETKWGSSESFPTDEMRDRGDYRRLWFGALVALPSGGAATLSVLSGNFGSLVGVAISASLLPPAVNTGLLFGYSLLSNFRTNVGLHVREKFNVTETHKSLSSFVHCTKFVDNNYLPLYSCDMPKEAALLSVISLTITLINILCICFMAQIVLLIKKVVPIISDRKITDFWNCETKDGCTITENQVKNGIDETDAEEAMHFLDTLIDHNQPLQQQNNIHLV